MSSLRLLRVCLAALVLGPATATGADPSAVPISLPGAPPLPEPLRRELAQTLSARGPDYVPRTRHRRPDGSPLYTNRLLLEASPYLQQHAHNPVNWYPWGDEAFDTARRLGRPVLISIGYSTCHWCHVMEEESFEDPETAAALNAHFVAIKVDREARPDVDAIYMHALNALGERGGWPLNIFATPDREPFFGGTYFPPVDGPSRPGFPRLLQVIHQRWVEEPERVGGIAAELTALVKRNLENVAARATRIPDAGALETAAAAYVQRADPEWGGVGTRPKFPANLPVRFLLRYHRRTGDEDALAIAVLALEKMAAGGIRDHLGGGFHRYATDRRWLVPHFEKMLYDNALLALAYLEAHQVTGRADFAAVTREILDYLRREMTSPEGGFYSATDADSATPSGEVEEGWFFTWTPEEIEEVLGAERAPLVVSWYGVTSSGNFEGRSILHTWRDPAEVAREHGISEAELGRRLTEDRAGLYAARALRPPPLRDDKILAAWNGLAISALARAGLALEDPGYVVAAARAADFVLRNLRAGDSLIRVYVGGSATGPAFLDDYAGMIAGLLDLYEAAPNPRWLAAAIELQDELDRRYGDPVGGGYYRTAADGEPLLARQKPGQDGARPSGNAIQALNLLRLGEFTGDPRYPVSATLLFSAFFDLLTRAPTSAAEMLLALDFQLDATKEVILVAPASGGGLPALLRPLRTTFLPNRILATVSEGPEQEAHAALVPLVRNKPAQGGVATAYVCENRVCALPTADPEVFARQLAEVRPLRPPAAPQGAETK